MGHRCSVFCVLCVKAETISENVDPRHSENIVRCLCAEHRIISLTPIEMTALVSPAHPGLLY